MAASSDEIEAANCDAQLLFHIITNELGIGFFSNKDLGALANTCRSLNDLVRPELTKRAASAVMQHVVYGDQDQAEEMIKANPSLLLVKTRAIDYSGRTIIGTPFQAALGAEDERMWAMMKPYFEVLESQGVIKSAQEEMKNQFDEQFPDGIESIPASELQPYYNDLAVAIVNNDDNGDAAIEAFRDTITKRKEIKSGKHFNMQHLIAAYQEYIDNFDTLATWPKRDKFWQKVIGYVQRQMPANYAQAHCSGIKAVLDDANQFKRTFDLYGSGKFFPVTASVGLGFDFAVYSYASPSDRCEELRSNWCAVAREAIVELCRAKTESLVSFKRELNPEAQKSRGCVIA